MRSELVVFGLGLSGGWLVSRGFDATPAGFAISSGRVCGGPVEGAQPTG